jgi:glycosyltransferase involved in cell wall biosynthesis
MTPKLISIAMATYNGEKFLREQLDSILAQTYTNLEIIICDDNSTDSTYEILHEYALLDSRIKLFKNETNLGVVKNFERVLSLSTGEFIALADQDDIWLPEKTEILLNKIENYDLVCSSFVLIDKDGKEIPKKKSFIKDIVKSLFKKEIKHTVETIFYTNFVTGCTTLVRKSLLIKALPIPDGECYHDWWIATVALKQNGIKYLFDHQLILYRQHAKNHTGIKNRSKESISNIQIIRLPALLSSNIFSNEEKNQIQKAIDFFTNITKDSFHIKAFFIAVKKSKTIWPNSSLLTIVKETIKILL